MDVPTTLVVTNDFPPRVGGIQRTLEALCAELPPDRVAVLCPAWDGAADVRRRGAVPRAPPARAIPPADAARSRVGSTEPWRRSGRRWSCSGPRIRLALLGPRLAARGTPYLAAAHGFEYWLSLAPGTHALMRYATSRAARVPVMCSDFIARTVRTAVPGRVPVSVLYPGADVDRFRPDLVDRRHPRRPGDRRPTAGGVRQPARSPQGAGRPDPGDRTGPRARAGARLS